MRDPARDPAEERGTSDLMPAAVLRRFSERFTRREDCWLWLGEMSFLLNAKLHDPRQIAREWYGCPPHRILCHNRACVAPRHRRSFIADEHRRLHAETQDGAPTQARVSATGMAKINLSLSQSLFDLIEEARFVRGQSYQAITNRAMRLGLERDFKGFRPPLDPPAKRANWRMDAAMMDKVKAAALSEGITQREWVERALRAELAV